MQHSQFPFPITKPFAVGAGGSYIRTIPVPSQILTNPGAASYTDGFPPLNFQPIAGGGIPPDGRDMNGILYAMSALLWWWGAGGPVGWDATTSAAIGGYPRGSVLQSPITFGLQWVSTVDNNVSNPDTGGAGWVTLISLLISTAQGGGTSFASIGYQNSWTDGGVIGGFQTGQPYFYKDLLGFVHVQGTVKNAGAFTNPSTVITLPSGHGLYPITPPGQTEGIQFFGGASNNLYGQWMVRGNGNIQITQGSNLGFSFGGNTWYGDPAS